MAERIEFGPVRYIKLGPKNVWAKESIAKGELHFGYGSASHELALAGDAKGLKQQLAALGRPAQHVSEEVRQVIDFYTLGADCLWITLYDDHLWWTFAEPEVIWHGPREGRGERTRKAIGGWRNTNVHGKPLRLSELSTRLTGVGLYRRSLCNVREREYLARKINGIVEPVYRRSEEIRTALLDVTADLIKSLSWPDFEVLTDVVFARSGWHRASELGGAQKDIDLALDQPTTGERAAVQVKSKAGQRDINEFIERCDKVAGFDRLFFVCHSPAGAMKVPERPDIHLWSGRELAETVLRLGLYDWLVRKVA